MGGRLYKHKVQSERTNTKQTNKQTNRTLILYT